MSIENVFAKFDGDDLIFPGAIYTSCTFNGEGTSLYYYIHAKDSQNYDAALKLDCFANKIRFTNFKKPHPVEGQRQAMEQERTRLPKTQTVSGF